MDSKDPAIPINGLVQKVTVLNQLNPFPKYPHTPTTAIVPKIRAGFWLPGSHFAGTISVVWRVGAGCTILLNHLSINTVTWGLS